MFSGERGQGRRKKKGRNPKKRRILVDTHLSPVLRWPTLLHFNFSLIAHPFLSLKSFYLFVQSALRYETIKNIIFYHSPRNQQSHVLFSFLFYFFASSFWFQVEVFFLFYQYSCPGPEGGLVMVAPFSFSLYGGVDSQLQSIHTVNTCI